MNSPATHTALFGNIGQHTYVSFHSPYPSTQHQAYQQHPFNHTQGNMSLSYRNDDILLHTGFQHLQLVVPRPVRRGLSATRLGSHD